MNGLEQFKNDLHLKNLDDLDDLYDSYDLVSNNL